ncbi:PAS domain S-box protein (plasmid) [Metabacillus endolithicus]|nr:PAS domain S-box protein [Metabacillus endolithicus]
MITDHKGKIISVNPAFTKLTGYEGEEVLGKNPNLLKSGMQDNRFYQEMWSEIERKFHGKVKYGIDVKTERII